MEGYEQAEKEEYQAKVRRLYFAWKLCECFHIRQDEDGGRYGLGRFLQDQLDTEKQRSKAQYMVRLGERVKCLVDFYGHDVCHIMVEEVLKYNLKGESLLHLRHVFKQ